MSEAKMAWTLGASRIDLHLAGEDEVGILWDATVANTGLAIRIVHRYNHYPEMQRAFQKLYDALDSCVELTPEVMQEARAALSKARGEQVNNDQQP